MNRKTQEKITTSIATLSLLEDKIVRCYFHDNDNFNSSELKKLRDGSLKLTQGKNHCVLVEVEGLLNIIEKVKELTSMIRYPENRIALAIMADSLSVRLLVTYYLNRNHKLKTQVKLFTSRVDALNWLRKHRDCYA